MEVPTHREEVVVMTTALSAPKTTTWYNRRGARWGALGVLAVGLLLMAVGVFGFVSAKQTNDDAAPTKAQVVSIQEELTTLTQQRDDAVAAAQEAQATSGSLDRSTAAVTAAMMKVDDQLTAVIDASDGIIACQDSSTDAAMLACVQSALAVYKAEVATLSEDIEALRAATTELEEATQ
jgi:hypothetical protein